MKESAILAEFVDEGRVEEAQASVLAVLAERFGKPAASSCRDAIHSGTKLAKLRRLQRLAVAVPALRNCSAACVNANSTHQKSYLGCSLPASVCIPNVSW
jgi:hypothetical protein